MLLDSLVLSAGLIALTYFTYKRAGPSKWAGMPAAGGLAVGVFLVVPMFGLHCLLVLPAVWLWTARRWRANPLLAYMIVAVVAAHSLDLFATTLRIAEFQRLRAEYAFESMETRLPAPKRAAPAASKETQEYLTQLEKRINGDANEYRQLMLERLHDDSIQSFITSSGFGVSRRILPTERALKVTLDHDGKPIPQPGPIPATFYAEDDLPEAVDIKSELLRDLHLSSVVNFANPLGFGLIVNRQKVAGFQPHQFNAVPRVNHWKIQTLDLVGLLMHAEPVVYVSDQLPSMEKLRQVPTRALNAFEAAGIKRLQEGDDFFIRETTQSIRMLGAVRSIEQCIACHGGERGALLGAFSYRLQRVP